MLISPVERPGWQHLEFTDPKQAMAFAARGLGFFSVTGFRIHLQAVSSPERHSLRVQANLPAAKLDRAVNRIDHQLADFRNRWFVGGPIPPAKLAAEHELLRSISQAVHAR